MFTRRAILLTIFVIGSTAMILLAMGRVPICTCGEIWLWSGVVASSNNSQHISDPYTFSHIIHGIAFYALLYLASKKWPMSPGTRLVIATLIEVAWEIAENTDMIINRYRATTISLDYYGDSVINSVSDILAMIAGYWVAFKLPIRYSVVLVLGIELFLLYWIRDNLTLNIIMLLYPLDAIKHWQSLGT